MAVQSEFYKDLSKFDPIIKGGLTKRQWKMMIQLIPGLSLILLQVIFVKGIYFWGCSLLTSCILITPPILRGLGKSNEVKQHLDFYLKYQERYFQTGQIRRYKQNEFVQKNGIKETDRF